METRCGKVETRCGKVETFPLYHNLTYQLVKFKDKKTYKIKHNHQQNNSHKQNNLFCISQ